MVRMKPFVVGLALCVLVPATARAQDAPLSRMMIDFLSSAIQTRTNTLPGTTIGGGTHEPHFYPNFAQKRAPFELNKAIGSQLSTFPVGSSSGGFSFRSNPATGEEVPTSNSFGPAFGERPFTIGRGNRNFGLNYQHVVFGSFDGLDLDSDGAGLTFYLRHSDCCPANNSNPLVPVTDPSATTPLTPALEGDLIKSTFRIGAKTDTVTAYGNIGVTDTLDIGVAVPIVRVDLRLTGQQELVKLSTGGTGNPAIELIHTFEGNSSTTTIPSSGGSKSGLGDILVRAKYNFVQRATGGVAGILDVRLPTGDEENLLGSGATQTRFLFVGSVVRDSVAPHLNIGYTFSSGTLSPGLASVNVPSDLQGRAQLNNATALAVPDLDLSVPDELNYVIGTELQSGSHVTFTFDAVGRSLRGVTRLGVQNNTFEYLRQEDPAGAPLRREILEEVDVIGQPNRGNAHLLFGAVGAKVLVGHRVLLTGNLLIPFTSQGLRPKVTPVFGFEYIF